MIACLSFQWACLSVVKVFAWVDINLLLEIEESDRGVHISGFVPFKSLQSDDIDRIRHFRVVVITESGKQYESTIRQTLADELDLYFPKNFFPRAKHACPRLGDHRLIIYIDGWKQWDTKFVVKEDVKVIWKYNNNVSSRINKQDQLYGKPRDKMVR